MKQHHAVEATDRPMMVQCAIRIAAVAGPIEAYVETSGTPAMRATCDMLRDLVLRAASWSETNGPHRPMSDAQIACLVRLHALAELLEVVRGELEHMLATNNLDRVVALADVFSSIDETLVHMDRVVPTVN